MKLLITISILLFSSNTIAQEKVINSILPKNAINFNVLGDLSIVSVSYERAIWLDSDNFLTSKLGIGYNDNKKFSLDLIGPPRTIVLERYFTIPYHITACFGNGKHFLELGAGGTYLKGDRLADNFVYPIFGYRLMGHKTSNGSLRIYLNIPIYKGLWDVKFRFYPFGLNLGIIF